MTAWRRCRLRHPDQMSRLIRRSRHSASPPRPPHSHPPSPRAGPGRPGRSCAAAGPPRWPAAGSSAGARRARGSPTGWISPAASRSPPAPICRPSIRAALRRRWGSTCIRCPTSRSAFRSNGASASHETGAMPGRLTQPAASSRVCRTGWSWTATARPAWSASARATCSPTARYGSHDGRRWAKAVDLLAGAGVWGAAQPGAARLDVGPHIALRIPAAGTSIAIAADWRFRIAGDARPGSGPTLTIASDF